MMRVEDVGAARWKSAIGVQRSIFDRRIKLNTFERASMRRRLDVSRSGRTNPIRKLTPNDIPSVKSAFIPIANCDRVRWLRYCRLEASRDPARFLRCVDMRAKPLLRINNESPGSRPTRKIRGIHRTLFETGQAGDRSGSSRYPARNGRGMAETRGDRQGP